MAKKKSANKQQTEVTAVDTRNHDEIIILNNGKMEEEEETLNILGTTATDDDIINIDTSFLDEELGITDAFEEMQVDVRPIGKGNQEKEHKKNKDKKGDKKDKDQNKNEKELSKKVLNTFSMVLRGEDFEPIPYPFGDNEAVYDLAFEQCVEMVDHMAVARFIKNNPTFTLKDAFRQVFTLSDDIEDDENEVLEQGTTDESFMNELAKKYIDRIEDALEKIINIGDEEPEVIAKELEKVASDIDRTPFGRLMASIVGSNASEIIRARINGDKIDCENMDKAFEDVLGKISESEMDEINKLYNENKIDVDGATERLISIIEQVSKEEKCETDLPIESDETKLQKLEIQLQRDLERVKESQKLFNKALSFSKGLITRARLTA